MTLDRFEGDCGAGDSAARDARLRARKVVGAADDELSSSSARHESGWYGWDHDPLGR
jgi:hypothetical protein